MMMGRTPCSAREVEQATFSCCVWETRKTMPSSELADGQMTVTAWTGARVGLKRSTPRSDSSSTRLVLGYHHKQAHSNQRIQGSSGIACQRQVPAAPPWAGRPSSPPICAGTSHPPCLPTRGLVYQSTSRPRTTTTLLGASLQMTPPSVYFLSASTISFRSTFTTFIFGLLLATTRTKSLSLSVDISPGHASYGIHESIRPTLAWCRYCSTF
ncbi:unnamed protein product [Ectocarpus sp. 6 AP-2014]